MIRGTAIYTGQDTQTFKLSCRKADRVSSARFRTNEALCELSYEAPYMGPEGGRLGRPTQAVRHTCSGIVKNFKLHHMSKNPSQKGFCWQEDGPPLANEALCLKHI